MGLPSTNLTRASAIISIIALAIVSISDFVFTGFWDQNAMATSVLADLLVLVVGVAVVNEFGGSGGSCPTTGWWSLGRSHDTRG